MRDIPSIAFYEPEHIVKFSICISVSLTSLKSHFGMVVPLFGEINLVHHNIPVI